MPQRTPLYDWHLSQGGRMVDFAGWELPVSYGPGIIAEHLACRASAALFDVSHMGRFLARDPGALSFLRAALTNDTALLTPGASQYTLLSDDDGRPLDDAYLFQLARQEYLLVVNAANREGGWQRLRGFLNGGAELIDLSGETVMLAVQGPAALAGVVEGPLPPPGRGDCVLAALERAMMREGAPVLMTAARWARSPAAPRCRPGASPGTGLGAGALHPGPGPGLSGAGSGPGPGGGGPLPEQAGAGHDRQTLHAARGRFPAGR